MRRRELLAGAAGLAVAGGAGVVTLGGSDVIPFAASGSGVEPVALESIEATGSEAGTIVVPEPGRVTFVELFATWCHVCERQMEPLGEAYDAVGSSVQFVSVTNEPVGRTVTRADVADWWDAHGGRWLLAHDGDLELTTALDASSVPYSFVLDRSNRVVWSGRGYKAADELLAPIEAALAEA